MNPAILRRLALLLLMALVVLVWRGSLHAPFVYDDKIEVVGNATIRDLDQWRAIASYNVSRPLLVLSYALDFDRHGLDPRGYHETNLLVAALAVALAFLLAESLLRLAGSPRPLARALTAAGLWAVHPMGVEAIVYITGRSESLCALFGFLSLWAWAEGMHAERAGGVAAGWRGLALLGFMGAVSSKEVGAMVPFAILALELCLRPGPLADRLRALPWRWALPVALALGLAAWLRLQHATSFLPREVDRPLGVQLLTQVEAWLHYLRLWLLPWGQTIFHHLPDADPSSPRSWLLLLPLLGAVGLGIALGRRSPASAFALLALVLFLLPSSSVVALKESMAEHRAFQSGFWLLLALAAALPARLERLGGLLALLLGLVLAGLSQLRHRAWSSEVALWQEAVDRGPTVAEAWYGLGDAQRFATDFDAAIRSYERAIELKPDFLDARLNLGIALASQGDTARAADAFRAALRRSPTACKAHSNLGVLAAGLGNWDEALQSFHTATVYCPDNARAHLGLCELYRGPRRDREKAVFHCQAYLTLAPRSEQAARVKEWLLELTF